MKKNIHILLFTTAILAALSFTFPFGKTEKGKLTIDFNHYVGNQLLVFDSTCYKNELGQTFSITNFKYYIGNIKLKKADGKEFIHEGYFLINEDEAESKKILLENIPEGEYTSISFMIGVDSLHNCSGAQSGALDPVNGMYWAWNTGYIFLKLEGKSAASNSPGNYFEYHIGGFKNPVNCIRTVDLNFANATLKINKEKTANIALKTDVSEILKTPVTIDFSTLSSVTDFHNATTIADNYTDIFSILKIVDEK